MNYCNLPRCYAKPPKTAFLCKGPKDFSFARNLYVGFGPNTSLPFLEPVGWWWSQLTNIFGMRWKDEPVFCWTCPDGSVCAQTHPWVNSSFGRPWKQETLLSFQGTYRLGMANNSTWRASLDCHENYNFRLVCSNMDNMAIEIPQLVWWVSQHLPAINLHL